MIVKAQKFDSINQSLFFQSSRLDVSYVSYLENQPIQTPHPAYVFGEKVVAPLVDFVVSTVQKVTKAAADAFVFPPVIMAADVNENTIDFEDFKQAIHLNDFALLDMWLKEGNDIDGFYELVIDNVGIMEGFSIDKRCDEVSRLLDARTFTFSETLTEIVVNALFFAFDLWWYEPGSHMFRYQSTPKESVNRSLSVLHYAVISGRYELASYLLEKGANPNLIHPQLGNPVFLAAIFGDAKMLSTLLEGGATIDAQIGITKIASSSATPLALITKLYLETRSDQEKTGYERVIEFLVQAGADVDETLPTSFETLLSSAVRNKDVRAVKFLCSLGADPNRASYWISSTPLSNSISTGKSEILNHLIAIGAKIDKDALMGLVWRPFSKATTEHMKVLDLLIRSGADINANDFFRGSFAFYAYKGSHPFCLLDTTNAVINWIDDHLNSLQPDAAFEKIYARIFQISEMKKAIQYKYNTELSLLFRSGKNGHKIVSRSILENHQTIIELLLAYNPIDFEGNTVAHIAARIGSREILMQAMRDQRLLETKNRAGATPLLVAFAYNQSDCAKLLLSLGADLYAKDRDGLTVLNKAISGCLLYRSTSIATSILVIIITRKIDPIIRRFIFSRSN